MARKLVIRLEGASPDLGGQANAEGVSLRFFSTYAKRLRDAYQRSAQAVLTGTAQDTGRLPKRATEVDIRLVDAKAGSLNLDLSPVDRSVQVSLTDNLADDALARLVNDLSTLSTDPESSEVPKATRALVATVPGEVRQRYVVMRGSTVEREVEITSTGVGPSTDAVLASVDTLRVTVRGVICVPRPAVILDTEDGRIQASTSSKWMEAAWSCKDRADLVATIVTSSSGMRLLAIRSEAEQAARTRVPTVEETLSRFDGVLRILAR